MRFLRALIQRSESNTREIARGGLINAVSAGAGALASFGLLVVVTRGTSLDTAGLFFVALALASAFSLFSSLGASTSITRTVSGIPRGHDADASPAIWAALLPVAVTNLFACTVGVVGSSLLASHLTDHAHAEQLSGLILVMMIAIPFMAVTRLLCSVSRAVDDPLAGALYDLAGQPILRVITCVTLVLMRETGALLGLTVTLPAILCCLGAAIRTRHALDAARIRCALKPVWHFHTAKQFWRFSGPRGLEEVVQAANIWLLTLLVGALASPAQAAGYAALTRFTMATTLVLQSVTTALLPRLAKAFFRKDLKEANRIFQFTTHWIIVASGPICLALLVFPATLLSVVSPDLTDVRIGLQVLALGSLVNVATGPVGGVVLMAGRSSINLGAAALAFAAMIIPAVLLIPSHGASGAALAWAISIATQNILLYVYAKAALSMTPWSRQVTARTATAVMVVALPMFGSFAMWGDSWTALILGSALSTALALVALLRLPPLPTPSTVGNDG